MKKRPKYMEVYDYIIKFSIEHNYLPSIREICEGVELKSTSSVASYMEMLSKKGYISREMCKYGYTVKGLTYTYNAPKDMEGKTDGCIGISEYRLHHILGVARKAYAIAKLRGHNEDFARKMFMIGWCHDVGYEFSKERSEHPNKSATMIMLLNDSCVSSDLRQKSVSAVKYHGKYIKEETEEWRILNIADLLIDYDGKEVDVHKRLEGIKERYGEYSDQYLNACEISYRVGLTTVNPAINIKGE